MSESPRRILHLIVEGFPPERVAELAASKGDDITEIFQLTETDARVALEKIFASDAVAVWGVL